MDLEHLQHQAGTTVFQGRKEQKKCFRATGKAASIGTDEPPPLEQGTRVAEENTPFLSFEGEL